MSAKHFHLWRGFDKPYHLVLLCCIKRLCIFGPKSAIQIRYYYYYYYNVSVRHNGKCQLRDKGVNLGMLSGCDIEEHLVMRWHLNSCRDYQCGLFVNKTVNFNTVSLSVVFYTIMAHMSSFYTLLFGVVSIHLPLPIKFDLCFRACFISLAKCKGDEPISSWCCNWVYQLLVVICSWSIFHFSQHCRIRTF